MKKRIILIVLNLLMGIPVSAQILTPAKWTSKLSKQDIKQGDVIELIFKIQLDATWHLYSNVQDYKIGPLPTVFAFSPNGSYKLVGDVVAIGAKKKYDDVFEVDVNYFESTAEFRQKVKILSKNPVIKGSYTYQVCTTVDGKCILGDDEFEFQIKTINK
ncbi:protein-disulfide reductase DsbD domain-containing protein [Mariniflexile rhizosphaerae]|uniref:protein-disulfide reductase DsbD domain-containing protein n=1 Tax=unclassified Mariniflexile TaxID=2643887 RepID=UPI000E3D0538|nr:protein-disulfide reductase DsbD domain-containing protein [Mariniflexile sp. TRM1-10]